MKYRGDVMRNANGHKRPFNYFNNNGSFVNNVKQNNMIKHRCYIDTYYTHG